MFNNNVTLFAVSLGDFNGFRISGGSFWGVQASRDHCFNSECCIPPLFIADTSPRDARDDAISLRHAAPDNE